MKSRIDGEIMVAKYALDQKYHHHRYFCLMAFPYLNLS